MGEKENNDDKKEKTFLRSFKFNYKKWNIGGKLIFISTVIAILSLLIPWIGGDARTESGLMQGASVFLAIYIYPFFMLAQDKSIDKKIGVTIGSLSIISPGIFLYYLSRDMRLRILEIMDFGIILYIIAGIILLIGIVKYEKYHRFGSKKEDKEEKKRGKPCPECDSPMEYEDEWDRWYCEECEKYR